MTKAASSGTATCAGLEGVEVDVEGVPGGGAGDGQGIEQADVGAGAALGLLAVPGQRERIGVVPEGEQQRHARRRRSRTGRRRREWCW